MANKDFKVKNKLVISGLTNANGVLLAENHAVDSHTNLATQYGGTGTTTSPTSGQIPYSVSGTTYTPTALNTLDVKGSSYSADAPSNPVVGQIWVESDTTSDSFDPNIIRRKSFTATAAQTVFTTDLEFIQGYEQVFFNGMLLLRNSDYTTASNTNVTLASGAAEGDIVEIVTVTNLNSVNTYTQGEIDTALSAKLSTSTAASTYLTQANAATTYVPQSSYFVAGKNKVINGDFKIWQRGAGAFTSSNVYTADRWVPGANQPFSISRQNFTPGTAPVAGYEGQHFLRIALTASSSTYFVLIQKIEDIRTFAGQTITLSYWAKADANVTNTASYERSTNSATLDSSYATSNVIGTTWQRYTATFNVPTISGATVTSDSFFGIKPILIQDGLAHTIDIWGVQVEAGSTATPFQTATGTLQGELAACQRYFYGWNSENNYAPVGIGQCISTTQAQVFAPFPVPMRVTPSLSFGTLASLALRTSNGGQNAVTAMAADSQQTLGQLLLVTVASGLSAGNATSLGRNAAGAGANIYWSAEL